MLEAVNIPEIWETLTEMNFAMRGEAGRPFYTVFCKLVSIYSRNTAFIRV